MQQNRHRSIVAASGLVALVGFARVDQSEPRWMQHFMVERGELGPTGRNPYFVLEPGYQLVLAKGTDSLTVTVLAQTKTVDGVETRVVEERETSGGSPVEVSRNFFAISRRTNSVFYFGEEVDLYKNGQVVEHEGAWESGVNGARYGLMAPGLPLLDGRYYQEIAPRVAMDRARIVSTTETLRTPAGEFTNVMKVEETTPLEAGHREYKLYAPGVGLLQDGSLRLVRFGTLAPH